MRPFNLVRLPLISLIYTNNALVKLLAMTLCVLMSLMWFKNIAALAAELQL